MNSDKIYRNNRVQNLIEITSSKQNEGRQRPLILTAAKETIENFERQYLCGRFHDPCAKTHEQIIRTLQSVSENFSDNDDEWKQVQLAEEILEKKTVDFQTILLKHADEIGKHVEEHKLIKEQVAKLKNDIEKISDLSDMQFKMKYIQQMESEKAKLEEQLKEREKYEKFMQICAEKHFSMMGDNEVAELMGKYYSLKENYAEWAKNFSQMQEDFLQKRKETEEEKRHLMTNILQKQKSLSLLPDLDNLRARTTDIQQSILDEKLKVNSNESDLLTLKNAVENLYSYLSATSYKRSKLKKNLYEQLDFVVQYCKDTQEILRKISRPRIMDRTFSTSGLYQLAELSVESDESDESKDVSNRNDNLFKTERSLATLSL
ncbi:uncharacterized protein LOC142350932 [Convolutriloba macropyga]|uniref:uncharacterized protein LOC142350932 n=1 Tax=Convolutriloba macropyga TaxID=536237 RepID=UPI003F51C0BC